MMLTLTIIFALLAVAGWILFFYTRREFSRCLVAGNVEFDRLKKIVNHNAGIAKEFKIWTWIFCGLTVLFIIADFFEWLRKKKSAA